MKHTGHKLEPRRTRQIETCAGRLGSWDRAVFLRDMLEAARLHTEATRLRRDAWARYREATGRTKRGAK